MSKRETGSDPVAGLKLRSAKITDLSVAFDPVPMVNPLGALLWAKLDIAYAASGLTPSLTMRVPVPFRENDSEAYRKEMALRAARQLIDHACVARQLGAEAPAQEAPEILAGLAQELGIVAPTTRPPRKRR